MSNRQSLILRQKTSLTLQNKLMLGGGLAAGILFSFIFFSTFQSAKENNLSELTYLNGNFLTKSIIIFWTMEETVRGGDYQLQKSIDGQVFEGIKDVRGKGLEVSQYMHRDTEVVKNAIYYYRVAKMEPNRSANYSQPIKVETMVPGEENNL